MTANPRTRWAEQIAVSPEATPDEVVAAFLRGLPNADFLPAPEQVAAVNVLANTKLSAGPDYTTTQLLRDEVEDFAERYWSLTPADRLVTWGELSHREANATRLRELEPGLDIPNAPLTDASAEELAAFMRELLVLPARERSIRRNSWLIAQTADETRWRTAFATVRQETPALAALDWPLAVALSHTVALQAQNATSTSYSRGDPPGNKAFDFATRIRESQRSNDTSRLSESHTQQVTSAGSFGGLWAVVAVVAIFVKLAAVGIRTSQSDSPHKPLTYSTQPYAPLSYVQPAHTHASHFEHNPTFTVTEVEKFKEYERTNPPDNNVNWPPRYPQWLAAGQPHGIPDATESRPIGFNITFTLSQIEECQEYDRTKSGEKPFIYEYWLKAGKPTEPGTYPPVPSPP